MENKSNYEVLKDQVRNSPKYFNGGEVITLFEAANNVQIELIKELSAALKWTISVIENSHEYKNLEDVSITEQLPFAKEILLKV